MKIILLALALQVTPDSMVVRVGLPTQQVQTIGDTTFIDIEVHTDSLAAMIDRAALAHQAETALHDAITSCACVPSEPGWYRVGKLAAVAAALLVWSGRESETTTITVVQEQSQEQTTRTIVKRFPWHRPWKRRDREPDDE